MAIATTNTIGAGNREDLTDDIYRIEPTRTPGQTMFGMTEATAMEHEWQVDDFSEVNFGGVPEGYDVGEFSNEAEDRARIGNRIERIQRAWGVSEEQEAVSTAGLTSEVANSEFKAMAEAKRDREALIFSDQAMQKGRGLLTSRCSGLGDYLRPDGPSGVPAEYRLPTNSRNNTVMASLDEDDIGEAVQSIYEHTDNKDQELLFFCGPTLKRTITDKTSRAEHSNQFNYTVNQDADDKKITHNVNMYEGDFGYLPLIPSNFLAREARVPVNAKSRVRGYLISRDLVKQAMLKGKGWMSRRFENQGGGERGEVTSWGTLQVGNPLGFGKFDATA